jgi:hypothetical protein
MLLLLINILIIIVVGAICFYLIDRFVRDGRLGNLLNCATTVADARAELLGGLRAMSPSGHSSA